MDMTAIIARAELEGFPPQSSSPDGQHQASATLDALVRYLDAICAEWATISESDRLAAVRLAADTARRLLSWESPAEGGVS